MAKYLCRCGAAALVLDQPCDHCNPAAGSMPAVDVAGSDSQLGLALTKLAAAIEDQSRILTGLADLAPELKKLREGLDRYPRETAKAIAHSRRNAARGEATAAEFVAEGHRRRAALVEKLHGDEPLESPE